jgi:uncharacterized secreted protein with C-terminal beta-propeller domain
MRKPAVLLAMVAGLSSGLLAASGGGSAAPDTATKSGDGARLQSFGSCANLLAYAKQHALPLVGVYGLGGVSGPSDAVRAQPPSAAGDKAAAAAGVDYSTTNVQEEGVDEPDLVKSNGSTLFVVRSDRLFAVDVRTRRPRLAGSLQLPAAGSYELLLDGGRLLVLSRGGVYAIDAPAAGVRAPSPYTSQSSLIEVDVSDVGAMRIVRSLTLDADYVSARLVRRRIPGSAS